MIRRPPRSTLFPSRRSSDLLASRLTATQPVVSAITGTMPTGLPRNSGRSCCSRSEEHTSELQSLRHLVCRLLLEKKKKQPITHTNATQHNTLPSNTYTEIST